MSTRTSLFHLEMAEKNKVKVTYPHKKRKKTPKFVLFLTHKFLVSRTVSTLKSQLKTWEAFFIKWTTSGEPLISLRSHQGSKWGHSWVILYFTNWSPPCIDFVDGCHLDRENEILERYMLNKKFSCHEERCSEHPSSSQDDPLSSQTLIRNFVVGGHLDKENEICR